MMPITVRALTVNLFTDRYHTQTSALIILLLFSDPWMAGAAAFAFYINDAATLLPRAVVAKARTYLAGAYADVLEVKERRSLHVEVYAWLGCINFMYHLVCFTIMVWCTVVTTLEPHF